MENNKNVNETTEVVDGMETDYIAVINDLKANTVSKEQYLKLKNENKKLLDSYARGDGITQEQIVPKESAAELRKALYGNGCDGLSNLDYWDKTLKLRELIIAEGKEDPFVPQGHNIVATDADRAAAQKVADVVQKCIDVADGDSSVFTNELQRYTADVNMLKARKK